MDVQWVSYVFICLIVEIVIKLFECDLLSDLFSFYVNDALMM